MSEITHTYTKHRKDFGRPPEFHCDDSEPLIDIAPHAEQRDQYILTDPYEVEIQNIPVLSEQYTNTERISLKLHGQNHIEGGWPAGIDPTEFEEKMKYCKKAEREDSYYAACRELMKPIEKYLKQNNAIDIYGEYFTAGTGGGAVAGSAGVGGGEGSAESGPPGAKTITVFKDPVAKSRTAASLSWSMDGKKIAVAYSSMRFQSNLEGAPTQSYVWDVTNPNEPEITLVPQSPLCSIEYYNKDPHLIAGGSFNGVLQFWDVRQGQRMVGKTPIEESHKDPVWDLKWLASKTGEILTVSTDGQLFIWDVRKQDRPADKPMEIKKFVNETVPIQPKATEGGGMVAKGGVSPTLGGICLDYDALVSGPQKYMLGTEQGIVLSCTRKSSGKSAQDKILATYSGHHGPVYTVQRFPTNAKFFLTVGDWTARVWCDETKQFPMYTTYYHKAHLTSGCWHSVRSGVFLTTRMDGVVDIWDLLYRQSSPVLSVQVSDSALHCIKCSTEGRVLAVGCLDGTTTLLELSPSLHNLAPDEKNVIGRMFENESQRDKNVLARSKELRQRRKKSAGHGRPDKDLGQLDESQLQQLSEEFLKEVEQEEEAMKKELESLEARRIKLLHDVEDGVEME